MKNPLSLVGAIFTKVAPKVGAIVTIEPRWGVVGQIAFKSGRKRYFRYSSIDINTLGASAIAKDKDYANFFMQRMGYPTIPGKTFFSEYWAKIIDPRRNIHAAWRYAKSRGLPVILKPNSGTWGIGVNLVHTKREFYQAMRRVFKEDRVALVQKYVQGKDYRIVVLDKSVISVYERMPLSVTGDGHSTILALLKKKQALFSKVKRDTTIELNDPRIRLKLKRLGMSLRSKLVMGEKIFLLDNANLSAGGDSRDMTALIHPEFKKIAVRLTRDMGLRMCGVDLMVEGDISEIPGRYWVLEINSAPGLDHYAKIGPGQQKIVEDLYQKVLKGMDR